MIKGRGGGGERRDGEYSRDEGEERDSFSPSGEREGEEGGRREGSGGRDTGKQKGA